ncbi:MAG: hypothetical protein ABSF26_24760, partial [Thermoguttaceae bacterium]
MTSLVKQLQQLADLELYDLCEAVELEMQRRQALADDVPHSAKRRGIEREQGYRRRIGAFGQPIRATGLGKPP